MYIYLIMHTQKKATTAFLTKEEAIKSLQRQRLISTVVWSHGKQSVFWVTNPDAFENTHKGYYIQRVFLKTQLRKVFKLTPSGRLQAGKDRRRK